MAMAEIHNSAEHHSQTFRIPSTRKKETEAPIKEAHQPIWQEKAAFLSSMETFFRACDINPKHVNPKPLGEGFTKVAFDYQIPGDIARVVKVPKTTSAELMSADMAQDQENIDLVHKFFGSYAVPTHIRQDEKTGKYLIVQDKVDGTAVASDGISDAVRAQLVDLARLNREMMRQTGHSMDFIGVPGMLEWARHSVRKIVNKKSTFVLSNLLVNKDGKVKIIDETLLRFRDVSAKQRTISNLGFLANRLVMRLYFGVDLLPKPEAKTTNKI